MNSVDIMTTTGLAFLGILRIVGMVELHIHIILITLYMFGIRTHNQNRFGILWFQKIIQHQASPKLGFTTVMCSGGKIDDNELTKTSP